MADPAQVMAGFVDTRVAAEYLAALYQLDMGRAGEIVTTGTQLGRIPARHIGTDGKARPARIDELDDELIWSTGQIPISLGPAEAGGHPLQMMIVDRIEISGADALNYAAERLGKGTATQPAAPPRDRGGRPTEHHWRTATRQVMLWLQEYGWPQNKAELSGALWDWFCRKYPTPPDQRTVEKFVADIWPEGRCELTPRDE